jgi:microcystin degradation protein MlrC
MKFAAAIISHETNTFSPIPTRLRDFGPGGPLRGPEAYKAVAGKGRSMSGMIAAAEAGGAEVDLIVFGTAMPARAVDEDAFETMCGDLCAAIAKGGYDALLLEVHGAMVTSHLDDGEGEILERVRKIAPDLPIALALDLHGNISPRTIEHCTTFVGYKTYPHIDIVETGRRAGELLMRTLRGEIKPTLAYVHCGIMPNMLRMATDEGAMAQIIAMAGEAEAAGALAVSVFGGFPLADCAHTGMSIIAMTDDDPDQARTICETLRDFAWHQREAFQMGSEPIERTIARAKALGEADPKGPILLVDTADNCHSGGTQDSMDVIAEALRQGLTGIAAGPISDPEAVATLVAAGVGAEIELPIGGKTDFSAIGGSVGPLTLRGTVRTMSDGRFTVRGPVFNGMKVALGRTIVFDAGAITLIICEGRCEPLDLANFSFVGIDPAAQRYVIIKSKIQYRPTFGAIASHVLDCNGVGFATLDYTKFTYDKVTRPLHPLDARDTLPTRQALVG